MSWNAAICSRIARSSPPEKKRGSAAEGLAALRPGESTLQDSLALLGAPNEAFEAPGEGLALLWVSLDWPLGLLAAGYLATANAAQDLVMTLGACAQETASLRVELRTDYVPVIELNEARVILDRPIDGVHDFLVGPGVDFVSGVSLAEIPVPVGERANQGRPAIRTPAAVGPGEKPLAVRPGRLREDRMEVGTPCPLLDAPWAQH